MRLFGELHAARPHHRPRHPRAAARGALPARHPALRRPRRRRRPRRCDGAAGAGAAGGRCTDEASPPPRWFAPPRRQARASASRSANLFGRAAAELPHHPRHRHRRHDGDRHRRDHPGAERLLRGADREPRREHPLRREVEVLQHQRRLVGDAQPQDARARGARAPSSARRRSPPPWRPRPRSAAASPSRTGRRPRVQIIGTNARYLDTNGVAVAAGRFLSDVDVDLSRSSVVLGARGRLAALPGLRARGAPRPQGPHRGRPLHRHRHASPAAARCSA